jgi:hypothetical protein
MAFRNPLLPNGKPFFPFGNCPKNKFGNTLFPSAEILMLKEVYTFRTVGGFNAGTGTKYLRINFSTFNQQNKQLPDDPATFRLYYIAVSGIPHAWPGTGGT